MRKVILCIICLSICLLIFSPFSFAAEGQQLQVIFSDDGKYLENAEFSLYYLGSVTDNKITPDETFSSYKVSFDISDSEKRLNLAETLWAYALRDDIVPDYTDITDSNGNADFGNTVLPEGAYLLTAEKHHQNKTYYFCQPAILVIPYGQTDTLIVTPKFEAVDEDTQSLYIAYRVFKTWVNDEEGSRPLEIQVQLLCDGEIYDTVTLGSENDWKYRWDNLSVHHHWTVTEKDVEGGYVVSLSNNTRAFILTNDSGITIDESTTQETTTSQEPTTSQESTTDVSETTTLITTEPDESETAPSEPGTTSAVPETDNDETEKDDEEELPVTGALRWPVPYLAMAGVFIFIIGYVKYRKSELENE